MKKYDPSNPLVSLHIPKTGGTSLRKILEAWFPNDHLKFHYRDGKSKPISHEIGPGDCVHGHFNSYRELGVLEYYPDVDQYLTFLRDPFDRFVSQWHYLNKMRSLGMSVPALENIPSFKYWLDLRSDEQHAGNNSFSFLCHFPVDVVSVPAIKSVINNSFIFIGIMENFQLSVQQLSKILNKRYIDVPHENARDIRKDDLLVWRNTYESKFNDEYEIYEFSKSMMGL